MGRGEDLAPEGVEMSDMRRGVTIARYLLQFVADASVELEVEALRFDLEKVDLSVPESTTDCDLMYSRGIILEINVNNRGRHRKKKSKMAKILPPKVTPQSKSVRKKATKNNKLPKKDLKSRQTQKKRIKIF